jgi:hypothetical protein
MFMRATESVNALLFPVNTANCREPIVVALHHEEDIGIVSEAYEVILEGGEVSLGNQLSSPEQFINVLRRTKDQIIISKKVFDLELVFVLSYNHRSGWDIQASLSNFKVFAGCVNFSYSDHYAWYYHPEVGELLFCKRGSAGAMNILSSETGKGLLQHH